METTKNNSKLKAIILILSLLLLGSIGYMYKMSTDSKTELEKSEEKYEAELKDKESVLNDLEQMKAKYDEEIASNTSLKEELEAEKAKIDALITRVKKGESVAHYKDDYLKLKREMDSLLAENNKLKEENAALVTNLDSAKTVIESSKKYNDTLVNQNEKLAKTVEKAQKLVIVNLKTIAVKERNSGKQIETDKASRADKLKISFTIAENSLAKSGVREYYVQVIDAANNVLGDKKSITFNEKVLTYSFISKVKYENNTVDVYEELSGKDFAKGKYYINIFNKGELLSNSTFELR
jgi:chromosome segregation ATPase